MHVPWNATQFYFRDRATVQQALFNGPIEAGLQQNQVLTNPETKKVESTTRVLRAAGWVIRPHTPPTKSGKTVVFFSLEEETGLLNVTVFPSIYEKYGHLIFSHPLLLIEGKKDKRGANSLVADKLWRLSPSAEGGF